MNARPHEPHTPFTGGCLAVVLIAVWVVALITALLPESSPMARAIATLIVVVLTLCGLLREYLRESPNHNVQLGVATIVLAIVAGVVVLSTGLVEGQVVMLLGGACMTVAGVVAATAYAIVIQPCYRQVGSGEGLWSANRSSRDRVRILAERLQRKGRTAELETELSRFEPQQLEGQERESWHHLWAVAAYQRGGLREALERFEQANRACPGSAGILYSLAKAYESVGEPDRAFETFDQCRFPSVPGTHALAQVRYAYLWDRYDKAFSYLQPLVEAYYEPSAADKHFLRGRGMPFFEQTWGTLGALCELTNDLPRLRFATEEALVRLPDEDLGHLLQYLEAVESGDFSELVEESEELAQRVRRRGWAAGHVQMRAAIVKAMHSEPEEAERILNAVELGVQDEQWLEDARLLARCAIAYRAGDRKREAELHKGFLARRPDLFEPGVVFDLRLAQYQERLKPAYREARMRADGI